MITCFTLFSILKNKSLLQTIYLREKQFIKLFENIYFINKKIILSKNLETKLVIFSREKKTF
jgi:hypothetical protein